MSNTLLLSSSHIVRIQYLLPSNSSQPASLIVTPNKSKPVMTTITKNISSNSYGYLSPQTSSSSSSEKTCNICKRLLYSFEEILICRICYGSYHWRCVRPETISFYGNNDNYICDKCNDSTTNTNSSHRLINSRNRTKSPESLDTNHRDFLSIPSRTSSTDANVGNTIQHFQEKQQLSPTHRTTKASELDDYLPSQTNENEYQQQNGQYDNDSRTTRQIQQQQQNGIETDDENENDRTTMFQANYQYTPLKEYAAMRGSRTTNDNNSNDYQNSTPDYSDRQPTSRYGGGLHYTNHGYDPTLSRVIGAPSLAATNFTSPTIDNLSIHNRQHHFVSTTNLNLKEKPSRHQQQQQQQQNSLGPSSPYLSPNRDTDSPVFKSSSHHQQEQSDRRSTIGSDSGIVIVNPSSQQQQQQPQHFDENHIVEKKLTNLVQQLGKQLENDAQKLNEKLEIKLKELENMINQQTYIIRRQDEVIENLKSKISEIETERDHFRNRLSVHEQHEQDEKKKLTTNETEKFYKQDYINEQDNQSDRKYSNTSTVTTDYSKPSTKKTPAPRVVEQRWSITSDEHEPTVAKIVKNVPINRERLESDTSSPPTVIGKLVSSTHLKETPAASSRLDNIIHQKNTKDIVNPSSSTYSLAQVRHQDRPQILEPISMEQQIITSVHHDDSDSDGDDDSNKKKNVIKQKRSNSSSSSTTTSPTLSAQPVKTVNSTTTTTTTTNRNSQKYPSFESLQPTYQNEQGSKLTTKTASLQFGIKPVRDEPGSIYMTPVAASHPAIQSNSPVKGWLLKQNRDSYLKRKERYYCILTDNALLLHRHDHDTTPHKAINLRGAKVLYYDDPKYGPSLELTWTKPPNDEKHYHLYAPNPHEAERWVTGIQTTIHNLDNRLPPTNINENKWQRYRMNT